MSSTAPSLKADSLEEVLHSAAHRYPQALIPDQLKDIPRIAFNIKLIAARKGFDVSVCDLGGGIGLFSVGCAAAGMRSTLVDDFNDSVNHEYSSVPAQVHREFAVNVISTDVVASPQDFPAESLDVVTSFDSLEHWHNSPKMLLKRAVSWLRPGGLFILGVPNCVNLRKRLTVPFGAGKWSAMADWYEQTPFRGHVREPDVDDLKYMARDLELQKIEIIGRNWLGYHHPSALVRVVTRMVDLPLRAFPTLCADLYLVGTKASV
jgi:2-polyprenyl-3-methyl-5-hydroxy-6-metoxy-1,4-benzoquinol methylase